MALKFTKNQTLILDIFFKHQDESFYLRQIARMLGKEPGVFQKDINKLVDDGLLIDELKANSRFFQLNKEHLLFNELKSIFMKTIGVAGTLKKQLKKITGISRAFIFGSFARGEETKASDIDLMIIGSAKEDRILDMLSKLEKEFGRPINYSLISVKEYQEKIKSKDSFLQNVLKGKIIEII